jgi:hypothetical protein
MVSHPPSWSDRQTNGKSGAGSGHGRAERNPGTPRKEGGGAGKDKAVQEPGLKDYVGKPFSNTEIRGLTCWLALGGVSR